MLSTVPQRKIRSYAHRDGRMTEAQQAVYEAGWQRWGVSVEQGKIDLNQLFGREADTIVEIGFGSGQSLLSAAKAYPEKNFIGIETYVPGIGALLLGMARQELTNIRVYQADCVEIFEQCLPPYSLQGVQIFFPDPWPKRRHHKRRLIQPDFINIVIQCLKPRGWLHLATDWEDYAKHMMKVLSANQSLINLAGNDQYALRSTGRPIVTKFEQRGIREGRAIWELQFARLERDNGAIHQ